MAAHGITGKVATITAGWQDREDDDPDLKEHLGGRTVDLRLHARAEQVFAKDAALHAVHRERQERLMQLQRAYRVRLEHAWDAARQVQRVYGGEGDDEERVVSS